MQHESLPKIPHLLSALVSMMMHAVSNGLLLGLQGGIVQALPQDCVVEDDAAHMLHTVTLPSHREASHSLPEPHPPYCI